MNNDKILYNVVIWVIFGIGLWKEKEALISAIHCADVDKSGLG